MIVVLTGGIASGKSTVTWFFKELGAHIIDWDVLAREVVKPHLKTWREIVEYFGREILNEDLFCCWAYLPMSCAKKRY